MKSMDGKVALVTGGGSGIGRSTALVFAREGAAVVVSDVNEAGGHETVKMCEQAGSKAVFIKGDVSRPEDCEAMVDLAVKKYGRLDYACNNAGIGGEANPLGDYSIEGWQKVIDINLSGVFYCMRYEIPAMLKNGGGSIVNISSILGSVAFGAAPAYVAAKHGVLGLAKSAAVDYAAQGLRVNTIGPGFIKTPLLAGLEADPAIVSMLVSLHPAGRLGNPDEVAEAVVWLCSDKASFVTGAYLPVDGGYLAR